MRRCCLVLDSDPNCYGKVISFCQRFGDEVVAAVTTRHASNVRPSTGVCWLTPPMSWVKVNVDGTVGGSPIMTTSSEVIRDESVFVIFRFGCYGDRHMVLGPSSSVLMEVSPVFVQQVEVKDGNGEGALVYGFSEKPELNKEVNWSSSSYLIVESYSWKGYTLWLNKGSKICMRWATQTTAFNDIDIVLVKGERRQDTVLPRVTFPFISLFLNEQVIGKQADYTIDEDDKYYVGVINSSPKSIMMTFNLSVTSMVYDVTKAKSMCSTLNGSCQLDLQFPNTHYVVVSTAGDVRSQPYGCPLIVFLLVLKSLAICVREANDWMEKPIPLIYKMTAEEDDETGSSEGLYDSKVCIICYEEERSCFFVPCGHCATCHACAQRSKESDGLLFLNQEASKMEYRWRPLKKLLLFSELCVGFMNSTEDVEEPLKLELMLQLQEIEVRRYKVEKLDKTCATCACSATYHRTTISKLAGQSHFHCFACVLLLFSPNNNGRTHSFHPPTEGEEVLLESAGKDATKEFNDIGHCTPAKNLAFKYQVGVIQGYSSNNNKHVQAASTEEPIKREMSASVIRDEHRPKYAGLLEFIVPLSVTASYCCYRYLTKAS
ncbi:hypothetical protein V6N13_054043 [Hibiscus sabdariffa]